MANPGLAIFQGTGPYRLFQDIKRFIFLFTLGLKKQWKQREMSCCRQNEKHPGSSPVYHGQKTENFKGITGTSKFISLTVDTGVFITLSMRSPPKKNSLWPLTVTRDFQVANICQQASELRSEVSSSLKFPLPPRTSFPKCSPAR